MRRFPSDVPVHRGSVGAMRVTEASDPDQFKPYVYRGIGVDQLELANAHIGQAPKPKPKRKKTRRRPEKIVDFWQTAEGKRLSAILDAEREAEREAEEWRRGLERRAKRIEKANERMLIASRRSKAPRPAEGWQPMKGSDLDELLAALED